MKSQTLEITTEEKKIAVAHYALAAIILVVITIISFAIHHQTLQSTTGQSHFYCWLPVIISGGWLLLGLLGAINFRKKKQDEGFSFKWFIPTLWGGITLFLSIVDFDEDFNEPLNNP